MGIENILFASSSAAVVDFKHIFIIFFIFFKRILFHYNFLYYNLLLISSNKIEFFEYQKHKKINNSIVIN